MTTTTTQTTTTIYDEDGLADFAGEGPIGTCALVIDAEGHRWLSYDHEVGVMCVRPPYEDEVKKPGTAFYNYAEHLPFPLTFITERPVEHAEYGDPDPDGDAR